MDESGCLSHAWPRKSPRRIQSDGARLQSATGAEHPWRRNNDGRGPGLKGGAIPARLDHANDARALTTASCAESQESRQKQAPVVYHRSTRAVSTQSARILRDGDMKNSAAKPLLICFAVGSWLSAASAQD